MTESAVAEGPDGLRRCRWCLGAPEYVDYHDRVWGKPMRAERELFEMLVLESFQSGLSWLTILRKRDAFRRAFAGFDFARVARFGTADVRRLLDDASIVRHRGKIESAIQNARRACELRDELGSLSAYFSRFEPGPASRPKRLTWAVLRRMAVTPESVALAADLRRRGWTFVGPTTIYAFMQAVGLVNDHVDGCFAREQTHLSGRA